MSESLAQVVRVRVDEVYRSDSRRIFATLIRLLGDFDLAEEALQDAFTAAIAQWPQTGIPDNPRAWRPSLISHLAAALHARREAQLSTRETAIEVPTAYP